MVGYNKNVAIEKCFASGTIDVTSNARFTTMPKGDFSIGGLIGKAENTPKINSSYSNVSIFNHTTDGWENYHFGPIVGSGYINAIQETSIVVSQSDVNDYRLYVDMVYDQNRVPSHNQLTLLIKLYNVVLKTKFEESGYMKDKYPNYAAVGNYSVKSVKVDCTKSLNGFTNKITYRFYVSDIYILKSGALYDKGVALQKDDNLFDVALSNFMTSEVTPFEDGNASNTHLPIQSVFKNDQIVCTWLEIDIKDKVATGSKMSPVGVSSINSITADTKGKYFYVTQDGEIGGGTTAPAWENKFINLNGHTLTKSFGSTEFKKTTITNGEIKTPETNDSRIVSAIKEIDSSYLFGINSTGKMYGYGFIEASKGSTLDSCSVNGTIISQNGNASAFALKSTNSTFRNVQIGNEEQTSIQLTEKFSSNIPICLAGVLLYNEENSAYIIGTEICDLSFDKKADSYFYISANNVYMGGITDQIGNNNNVKIYGNISIEKLSNTITFADSTTSIYFGGVVGSADDYHVKTSSDNGKTSSDNGKTSSYNFVLSGSQMDLECTVSKNFYIGAMFGSWCNTNKDNNSFSNKVVKSNINVTTTGSAREVEIGLIGLLDSANIELSDIDLSEIEFSVVNSAGADMYNFGGFVGGIYRSGITMTSIKAPSLVQFETTANGIYDIGGIIGYISNVRETKLTEAISYNVHAKINAEKSTTYVGGFVGSDDGDGTYLSGESSGDVIATSSATQCADDSRHYSVVDARKKNTEFVYNQGSLPLGQVIEQDNGGRGFYSGDIPLAVGGVVGYTRTISKNVTKSTGSVRALLTKATSSYITYLAPTNNYSADGIDVPSIYKKYYDNPGGEYSGDNYAHKYYTGAFINNEEMQCRAGAYAGLAQGVGERLGQVNMSSTVRSIPSFYTSPEVSIIGLGIVRAGVNGSLQNSDYLGYISPYKDERGGSFSTYKVKGCSLPVSYGNNIYNYNYNLLSGQDDSILSTSYYNEQNIFDSSNKDDATKDYATKLYEKQFELQKSINGINLWTDERYYTSDCLSKDKSCAVFAGFMYNGVTYNRSYWMMPRYSASADSSIDFYTIPHWAGESIGGVA